MGGEVGTRAHRCDRKGIDNTREKHCQDDFTAGVEELNAMRREPGCENMILSGSKVKRRKDDRWGTRIRFGLLNPTDLRYSDETVSAKACHQVMRWAIWCSFLRVAYPKFDASAGMSGLTEWTRKMQLVRLFPLWLLLLPLLLLLLLWMIPWGCDDDPGPEKRIAVLGSALETRSLLLILDKSQSMQPTINQARDEMRRFLDVLIELNEEEKAKAKEPGWFSDGYKPKPYYANIIYYEGSASSVLGGLKVVSEETKNKLLTELDSLRAGGSTNLHSAIEKAGEEVSNHKKPTTILIATDAEDGSIRTMQKAMEKKDQNDPRRLFDGYWDSASGEWLKQDGRKPLFVHATTPKFLDHIKKNGETTPYTVGKEWEEPLTLFCENLNGYFPKQAD